MSATIRLSVIIPFYNAERTLGQCLEAVQRALNGGMEVLLVDDGSDDGSPEIARSFPYRHVRLERNSGAAKARNEGARLANGEILLFLDSDVIVSPDTFEALLRTYEERPDVVGVSAIYSDRVVIPGFFQEFKALEETFKYAAYQAQVYSGFGCQCGSVKRAVFFEVGGFNTYYRGADTEDAEFGHRLARRYRNCINPAVRVDHIHHSYRSNLRNYLRRTFHWSRLFLTRRRFEEVVTTPSNAASVILSGIVLAGFTSFVVALLLNSPLAKETGMLAFVSLALFCAWNHRFFFITLRRHGVGGIHRLPVFLWFMVTLQWAVGLGAAAGLVWWSLRRRTGGRRGETDHTNADDAGQSSQPMHDVFRASSDGAVHSTVETDLTR